MSRIASGLASRRLPRLNTTTRAIRGALLASTAALLFAGAPAAFAGTCVDTGPLEVTCTGVFTDTVNNTIPLGSEVPDLTLILDDGPTTVTTATGVVGLDASWGGDVTVLSYADFISDSADAIYQYGSDTATLNSYGDISTYVGAIGANAIDINALNDVYLVAGGNVSAYSDVGYDVLTVTADSAAGNTNVLVDSTSVITATAATGDALGIYSEAFGDSNVTVDGSVYAVSGYNAGAVISRAYLGDSTVINNGTISGDAYTHSNGVVAGSKYGSASVSNYGDISATSYVGNAIGVLAYTAGPTGDIYLGNTGTVDAESVYGASIGMAGYAFGGDASFYNAGSISSSGYYAAVGGAVSAYTGSATASNYGDISASASGYDAAIAVGLAANGVTTATVYNAGSVSASATASDALLGNAYATGITVAGAYGDVTLSADSTVSAYASAAYYARAVGVNVYADDIAFSNAGAIDASVAGYGTAFGTYLEAQNDFTAYNTGSISADATGEYAFAVGALAQSVTGSVSFYNDGDISATSEYSATGIVLSSDVSTYLYNSGSISADGGYASYAIYTPGLGDDTIVNQGTINGSIHTFDGDDYLYNGSDGIWNAVETSDFGAGDDVIVNEGTINMDDATIDLGYHAVVGNGFYNNGTITLEGDNVINMGNGLPLLPALNPNPFYNDGVLDFQDGAPNDTLTIIGDFAGDGDINVDVSGLNGSSDLLYIEGSVAADSVSAINVDLLDLSQPIDALIPIVYVAGTSVDGNFVLGDVNWSPDDSFVNLDFDIVSDIDASNATPDVFSLGIEATGLSDPGTLAASIAPGVHSLMNSQVGTWRQRMGVINSFDKGGISLWARVFRDKGSFNPGYTVDNFGTGGNYAWDQKNSGVEGGIDFAVTDEFSLGLLAAKSKAEMSLIDPGNAHSELDADTYGVYGTWISPSGFYLDTSYRWTKFELDLNSVAGPMQAEGDAETFNIEGGYAFTLSGGLKIEPQLQYTKTTVDNLDLLTTASGMTFRNDGGESSRGRAGVAVRKSFGDADTGWEITPHATLSAVREFEGESNYAINDSLFGRTTVEGTSTLLELGVNARRENLAIYAGVNWQDGGAMNNFIGGQVGMRYTFGGASPAPAPVAVVPAAPVQTCADLDDDSDGVNNCNDKCLGSTAGQMVGADGCPVPAPEPEPVMEPKPYRG